MFSELQFKKNNNKKKIKNKNEYIFYYSQTTI